MVHKIVLRHNIHVFHGKCDANKLSCDEMIEKELVQLRNGDEMVLDSLIQWFQQRLPHQETFTIMFDF